MKNQALFSSNDKSKKLKCRLLQFLFGALRVNPTTLINFYNYLDQRPVLSQRDVLTGRHCGH